MTTIQESLKDFEYICNNPREILDKHLDNGIKVIGCLPYYNVQPIIESLGMAPIGMWGARVAIKSAGKYSPQFTCSLGRACVELGILGKYDGLSVAVMPILCDTLRGEVTAWRAGVKDIKLIPFVPPQNRKDSNALNYFIEEIKYVTSELEKISGEKLENNKLQKMLNLYNERNDLIKEFAQVANDHLDLITPLIRHYVIKAASFLRCEDYIGKIKKLIELLKNEDKCEAKGKRAVLTGIMLDSKQILQSMQENGINVVADDLLEESRLYRYNYPPSYSALESFARQYIDIRSCSLVHDEDPFSRGKMLVNLAKETDADVVILCMMRFCDPEEYDEPYVTKMIRDSGYMAISIDIDQSFEDEGQAKTKIQALAEI